MKAVMRDEREMKDSGIEWINLMPKTWRLAKIGAFFDITLGKMLESKRPQDSDASLENYICATNLKWNGIDSSTQKQMWFSKSEKNQYLLEKNDILVMEGGLAGTSSIYHGEMSPCYMQNSVNRCRKKSTVNNIFLYYWLYNTYHLGYVESICNRATIMHYTKEKLSKTPLVVPTVKESGLIGNYLEGRCGKIDALIAEAKASIEEYKELKQAVIAEKTTKGLDKKCNLKDSGFSWMGTIPNHWELRPFRSILNERNEKNNPIKSKERLSLSIDKGVTLYAEKTTNLDRFKEDFTAYKLAYKGDLVMNSMNMIVGASGVSEYFGCVSPVYYTYYDDTEEHITAKYCEYLFRSRMLMRVLHSMGRGIYSIDRGDDRVNTCRLKISRNDLRTLILPLPPLKEQYEIVDYLDNHIAKVDELISEKQSLIEELESYKKSLIYEVVTGKRKVVE